MDNGRGSELPWCCSIWLEEPFIDCTSVRSLNSLDPSWPR